jgi:hypothetical protein
MIGNVFHTKDIEEAIEKGKKNYDPDDAVNSYAAKSMGIDPAYGSSNFGIVITQFCDVCYMLTNSQGQTIMKCLGDVLN